MQLIINAACVYAFLLIVFRVAGRRTMAHLTTFDLVLVLLIGEAAQGPLLGRETSLTGAVLVILTLVGLDVLLAVLKARWPIAQVWLEGLPLVVVRRGRPVEELIRRARLDIDDVLMTARESHGLSRLDQIDYAVLETNGRISVIPKRPD